MTVFVTAVRSGWAWSCSAATRLGFALRPLMRRKTVRRLSMPAAVQRNTIWPSRQRVTFAIGGSGDRDHRLNRVSDCHGLGEPPVDAEGRVIGAAQPRA
jgi:hypothetical protein